MVGQILGEWPSSWCAAAKNPRGVRKTVLLIEALVTEKIKHIYKRGTVFRQRNRLNPIG